MPDLVEIRYPITGIILSGGKSLRMGQNKAFIPIEGLPIIERTHTLFKKLFNEIIIVTNQKELFLDLDARICSDLIPDRGALGGLYTGLYFSSSSYSFCVASDMPFLNESLIRYLLQWREGYDVIVPKTRDGLQPLHALYSKNCLEAVEKIIQHQKYRIIDFYPTVSVKVVEEKEFFTLDPLRESFLNINTREELISVRKRKALF